MPRERGAGAKADNDKRGDQKPVTFPHFRRRLLQALRSPAPAASDTGMLEKDDSLLGLACRAQ
jgi:hypothetical protein